MFIRLLARLFLLLERVAPVGNMVLEFYAGCRAVLLGEAIESKPEDEPSREVTVVAQMAVPDGGIPGLTHVDGQEIRAGDVLILAR